MIDRKALIDWLCEHYPHKQDMHMLYGYRRALEGFTNTDLESIKGYVERNPEPANALLSRAKFEHWKEGES